MPTKWTNLTDAIFHHAAQKPKAIAVEDAFSRLTYKQFADLIGRAAVWLKSLGIEAGQPVGVRMTNSIDHLVLSLALMRIGAAKVEFEIGGDRERFRDTVARLGVKALFIEPPLKSVGFVRCISIGVNWRADLAKFKGDFRHEGAPEPMDILLSSGSTGPAKGIPSTHALILERLAAWDDLYVKAGMLSRDYSGNFLLTSSMSFAGFITTLLARLVSGGKVTILLEFSKLFDFVRAIRAQEDAILVVTPAMCQGMLACAPEEGLLFPDVRSMICTGTSLPARVKQDALRSLTPNFTEMYGNAGAGVLSALFPDDIAAHADSVGRVIPGLTVEIVDAAGEPVPAGMPGHLRCKGPGVALGQDAATGGGSVVEGARDGWYYPGDLAAIDKDGFLYLKGRAADIVSRAGTEIYPSVVELALMDHPAVQEAAVLGIRDRQGGMDVVALVLASVRDAAALRRHCIDALGAEQAPDIFLYVESFPRTPAGKIDRAGTREYAMRRIESSRAGR